MKHSMKDQIKGKLHETKGIIKKVTGKILGNTQMEVEGEAEKASGKAQKKIGEVEKVSGE